MLELIINGIQYRSISEAAKALGLDTGLLSRRVNGLADYEKIDQPPIRSHSTKAIPISINGRDFPSISAAARFYDMNYPSFYLAIKNAFETGSDDLFVSEKKRSFRPGKEVTIDGVTYSSWTEAACKLNVCYATFVSRMKRGYYRPDPPKRQSHAGTPVFVNGKRYQNHKECAAAYNMKHNTLLERIRSGASIDIALDEELYKQFRAEQRRKNVKPKVWINGQGYANYADCARAHGLQPAELYHRMKYYHLSLADALNEDLYKRLSEEIKQKKADERRIKNMENRKAKEKGDPFVIANPVGSSAFTVEQEYIW